MWLDIVIFAPGDALQLAESPQSVPMHVHVQVHAVGLVMPDAVHCEQRLIDGVVAEVMPLALPQTPFTRVLLLVVPPSFVLTKFHQRPARAVPFPAATINGWMFEFVARVVPE